MIKSFMQIFLRKKEPVDLEVMKQVVKEFIDSVMVLTEGDREYIKKFMQGGTRSETAL